MAPALDAFVLDSTAAIPRPVAAEKPPPQAPGTPDHANASHPPQESRNGVVLALIQHIAGDEPPEPHAPPLLECPHDPGGKRRLVGRHDYRGESLGNRGQDEVDPERVAAAEAHGAR